MADEPVTSDSGLKLLPLHEEHERLGARMVEFGGWLMPLSYGSIIEEHLAVRSGAGLFDISHMGAFLVRGQGAFRTVQSLVPTPLEDLQEGYARYTLMLTPQGGIIDDLIVYRRSDGFLLVVNAARTDDDRDWIDEHLDEAASLDDLTEITALFALQGPDALGILAHLSADPLEKLPPFTFLRTEVADIEVTVMRTGYTGERGAELLVERSGALELWSALLAGTGDTHPAPAGLGARDTLRLEAALLLNGQDINETTTPFEARLGWLVGLDGHDFVGRDALLELRDRPLERILVGLAGEARGIPRTGTHILSADAPEDDGVEVVGRVTSGSISPVLGHPIALGYVRPEFAEPGTGLAFDLRGRRIPAKVVERPFYKRGKTPLPAGAAAGE